MKKIFLNFKKFEKIVKLGFFTSRGGVSKGNFYSLNCNKYSADNRNNVLENISIAKKSLGLEEKKLILINQVHSKKIYYINKKNLINNFSGDGLITQDKNIAIGVLTADCAPIFLFDSNKKIICCLHSGWKGALENIVKEGVNKIKKKRINNNDIFAVVGPCLGAKYFDVDKEFKYQFIKKNKSYAKFFKSKNKNKDSFDLRKVINYQLERAGIKKIYNLRRDTYENTSIFYSHRRSTHKNNLQTGRMINIISLMD